MSDPAEPLGRRLGRAIFQIAFFGSQGFPFLRLYDAFADLVESPSRRDTFSTRSRSPAEAEFVAAFDVLLRNHREFVPPQHFLERLTHILLRKRERVARSVFRRDDDDEDDDEDDDAIAILAQAILAQAILAQASLVQQYFGSKGKQTKVTKHGPLVLLSLAIFDVWGIVLNAVSAVA